MLSEQVLSLAATSKYDQHKLSIHQVVSFEELNTGCSDLKATFTNYADAFSVMSLPSPNGSTSSHFSSEDSSSNVSSRQPLPHLIHASTSSASPNPAIVRPIKFCKVCGDRAKSYHFGGISCDSCKAFFRRSVQNDAYRNFHCPYDGHCDINITSRKCCQYCRFHKCLSIGMEKGWVMSEEERVQMLKNRLEKKKQSQCVTSGKSSSERKRHHSYQPSFDHIHNFLNDQEINTIENMMNHYYTCVKEISLSEQTIRSGNNKTANRTDFLDAFFTLIRRFAQFVRRFEQFSKISQADQEILLRRGVLEACFIRSAFLYEMQTKSWQHEGTLTDNLILNSDDLKMIIPHKLFDQHMHFISTFKSLHLDEATVMMIIVIVFLTPDRVGLIGVEMIQREQEYFLILLEKYMNWRYNGAHSSSSSSSSSSCSSSASSSLYPKLLLKLADLRELAEAHTDFEVLLGKKEIEEVNMKLATLHMEMNVVEEDEEGMRQECSKWTILNSLSMQKMETRDRQHSFNMEEELSISSEGSERLMSSD